ncbi:MAG: hypothetical protein JNL21_28655 [Myxococcales bacterium]|nr:hypothetical protein [Myxococcales bacterium]
MSLRWLKGALTIVFVLVLGAAGLTFRVIFAGEQEIAKSTSALEAGDPDLAIDHARAAATWYAPGAPHVRVAYGRLLALARESEARKRKDLALRAYRAITTASSSTAWAIVPHAADAEAARAAIARLESTTERPVDSATEPPAAIEQKLLAELAREPGPSRGWSLVLGSSFLLLLAGLAVVLQRALDETGRLHPRPAAVGAVIATVGLFGYALALWLA